MEKILRHKFIIVFITLLILIGVILLNIDSKIFAVFQDSSQNPYGRGVYGHGAYGTTPGTNCSNENEFCGGIAGIICCEGLACQLEGNYSNAGGKCVKETSKCVDSDGEKDYYTKGTTTLGSEAKVDTCNNYKEVTEYYCEGNSIQSEIYTCPDSCEDGACLTVAQHCSDCGKGVFAKCSRKECEAIPSRCYFIDGVLSNGCKPCSEASCKSYNGDQTTCAEDPCNLGSCTWAGKSCTVLCSKEGLIQVIVKYFNNPTVENLKNVNSLFANCIVYRK